MMRRFIQLSACVVVTLAVVAPGAMAAATTAERYEIGTMITFAVETRDTCWWCGCCCDPACDAEVAAWHVADASGVWIYSVVHDAPVTAANWQGTWSQTDATGVQLAAGIYSLVVDTTGGRLSRCIELVDPCTTPCWSPCRWWNSCCFRSRRCTETASLMTCCCEVSLVFVDEPSDCFPFSWPCSTCP